MLNLYCWKCGNKINKENILGKGQFDKNTGEYSGRGFAVYNCSHCKKTRYQILDYSREKKVDDFKKYSSNRFDIDQVIEFHRILKDINSFDKLFENFQKQSNLINSKIKRPILKPLDVYNLFIKLNKSNKKRLMILTLDSENYLLSWEFLGEGASRPINFEPRIIFNTPFLLEEEAGIIIAQNTMNFSHPTQKEVLKTKRLSKAGKILGINFLDYIIIDKNGYQSFDQLNYI